MKYIHSSETESERFGLKIGRTGRLEEFKPQSLISEIYDGNYDIVKMKLALHHTEVFQHLDMLPYLRAPLNYITLQHQPLTTGELPTDPDLHFELYTGNNPDELVELVRDISGTDTNLYYQSDLHDLLMPPDKFWDGAHAFYLSMDNSKDAGKYLFIGRNLDGKAVGICSFQRTTGTHAEGVIYGVRPEFRGNGYAASFLNHSVNTLYNAGYTDFFTEVQYFNFRSLYPHIHMGFKPAGMFLNLILFPLLERTGPTREVAEASWLEAAHEMVRDQYAGNLKESISPQIAEMRGSYDPGAEGADAELVLVAAGPRCAVVKLSGSHGTAYARYHVNI